MSKKKGSRSTRRIKRFSPGHHGIEVMHVATRLDRDGNKVFVMSWGDSPVELCIWDYMTPEYGHRGSRVELRGLVDLASAAELEPALAYLTLRCEDKRRQDGTIAGPGKPSRSGVAWADRLAPAWRGDDYDLAVLETLRREYCLEAPDNDEGTFDRQARRYKRKRTKQL